MRLYRYPRRTLAGDYLRTAAGLGVGLGVLLSVPITPLILVIFGGLTGLFGFYGLRTLERQIMELAVTDDAICRRAFGSSVLSWRELEHLKLRYYGSRRQLRGNGGFMQLTLRGGGSSLTLESSVEGFRYIAWRAAKAMRDNKASMDPASAGNLLAIGLDADSDQPPPDD